MQTSTSVPTVARHLMMSSISSFARLTRQHWYRQTYGADRRTLSGNSAISRRETHIEMNMDWKANNNNPWICGQTPPEWLHCWPDGRRSWLNIGLHPLARVMGVGRQQEEDPFQKLKKAIMEAPLSVYPKEGGGWDFTKQLGNEIIIIFGLVGLFN